MCGARLSKAVLFLLILPAYMTHAYVGPFMSEMTFHTAYMSTNCTRLIKVSYAQCVKEFADSKNDVMNFWRLATLCELCSTVSINDTSGQGSIDKVAIGALIRYKYFVGSNHESLSTHKQAEESSHYDLRRANLAVDGNASSFRLDCTHTKDNADEWWMVDLGRVFQVTTVTIINRDDLNGVRLAGIIYEVGIAPGSWEECGRFLGPADGAVNITATCDRTMYGRYVRIRKIWQTFLSLCEVYVYS